MSKLLAFLDEKIEKFRIKTGDYPKKITMTKQIYDKMIEDLSFLSYNEECGWVNKKDNYRGIEIIIEEIDSVRFE